MTVKIILDLLPIIKMVKYKHDNNKIKLFLLTLICFLFAQDSLANKATKISGTTMMSPTEPCATLSRHRRHTLEWQNYGDEFYGYTGLNQYSLNIIQCGNDYNINPVQYKK